MFGAFVSALNVALRVLLTSTVAKFFVFFALYFVVHGFVEVIDGMLPSATTLSSGLAGLSAGTWYFLDLMGFSTGAPAVVSAYALRFLIRRIPLIG